MRFADAIGHAAHQLELDAALRQGPEPLAQLAYGQEMKVKKAALALFWRENRLPGKPGELVQAPSPRHYRHTSKRRAEAVSGRLALGFPGERVPRPGVMGSELDPVEHLQVYAWSLECFEEPWGQILGKFLNWVVVRGAPGDLCVIYNLRKLDAAIVRAAKRVAELLQQTDLGVKSAWLFHDPTASDYYLEAERPEKAVGLKKLFGQPLLRTDFSWSVDGPKGAQQKVSLRFPPTAFFQGNASMLAPLVATVARAAGPLDGKTLVDLYCGSGLFSFSLGGSAAGVLGVDWEGPGIEAARGTAHHLGASHRMRFWAGNIDADYLETRLPQPKGREVVLLDPPRQGTGEGVVAAIADRGPERVVHICCGTDTIPDACDQWRDCGYQLESAIPLDLFPGTAGLETVLGFVRN